MTPTTKKTTTRKPAVKRVKLPPNPFIHEILELVGEQRSKAKRVDILKEYRDDSLTAILIWNFDERVQSAVPDEILALRFENYNDTDDEEEDDD